MSSNTHVPAQMLQGYPSSIRPTVGAPRHFVKVRRERPGRISPRVLRQLNSDKTGAPRGACKEWAIVQQAIAGNADAHEHLFARQTGALYRAAFALLRNKEDAEDALQDGLCKAYTSLRSFQGRSSFSTWLTRIVINSALMTRRKKRFHPDVSLDEILDSQRERLPQGVVDARPDPEKIFAAIEINALVEKHVRQLPPRLRAAYRLRATNSLSAAESSQVLGIPASAVKSQISRARRSLVCGLQRTLRNRAAYRLNHNFKKTPHECYNEKCLG
jgi:RNA polymerase sigma-70 factor, ECF subfamily